MRFIFLLCLISTQILSAQTLSYGVKLGGFFTEPAGRVDDSRRYLAGPVLELGFGSRVAVEANALYSRFRTTPAGGSLRGHSVEFPVLGKYYFADRSSVVRPYASGGFAFRNIWFDNARSFRGVRINSTEPAVGAVFGGGVTFRAFLFKLSPEIRYTRWGGANFPSTNPNQVQAMLGITF